MAVTELALNDGLATKLSNISGQDHSILINKDYVSSGHTGFQPTLSNANSISITTGNVISLVNDETTPGNSKYYGIDGSGNKGYHALPAGGGGSSAMGMTIDNGVDVITTGVKGYIVSPFDCNVSSWSIVGDISGSIVIDVWKTNGAIPTVANTITGSQKPTLVSQQLATSSNVSTWIKNIVVGDVIGYNVDTVSNVTSITLTIGVEK